MADAESVRVSARLARRTLAAAVAGGCVFCALGPATPRTSVASAPVVTPVVRALLEPPAPAGLPMPDWTPPTPAERSRQADVLTSREAVPLGTLIVAPTAVFADPVSPSVPVGYADAAPGRLDPAASAGAVEVALRFALSQVGKPYVWGAEGPDSYDCSGLVQTSYAAAGVALPRTSREQALVGTPIALADLQAGDLVFWAYDTSDLSTVHHVALYAGDGLIVQAPQPGETVEVARMWLDGYAGAVRVATGAATIGLSVVPSTGLPAAAGPATGDPADPVPTIAAPGATPSPTPTPAPSRSAPVGASTPAPRPSATATPTPTGTAPARTTPVPTTPPPTTPPPATPPPATTSPTTTPPPATTPPGTPTPTPSPTAPAPTAPAPTAPAPTAPAPTNSAASPSATVPPPARTTSEATPTATATATP